MCTSNEHCLGGGGRLPLPGLVHHRSLLVNSYPAVSATQPRLDFSFYEYPDISRFAEARSSTHYSDSFQYMSQQAP